MLQSISSTLVVLIAALNVLLFASPAHAGVASTPMQWSKGDFADEGQAVEHVTLRASNGAGQDTFMRFSVANAGFKRGQLEVTLRQEAPGGTFYGHEVFARGDYSTSSDRMGITAGKHSLSSQGGTMTAQFAFENLTATVTVTSWMSPFSVVDKGGSGYIWRELMAPVARVAIHCVDAAGRTFDTTSNGYAVHEASTAPAHRIYDRAVQMFRFGGTQLVADYIVLPSERGGRPLGFLVAVGKGKAFAGEVVKEVRSDERVDSSNDYRVPYQVQILAKRGNARAAMALTGEKQVSREDDLADLNWAARKAVGSLMHPVTYLIKGNAQAEVQSTPEEAATVIDSNCRYKYAQTR